MKTFVSPICRRGHKIEILNCNAGHYIGTRDASGPFCRVSERYFATAEEARKALVGGFDCRKCIENDLCCEGKGCFVSTIQTEEDRIVGILQTLQSTGYSLVCPRCGGPMPYKMDTAALSRRVKVYICSRCGKEEAILDWLGNPDLVMDWKIIMQVQEDLGTNKSHQKKGETHD